jgi:putative tryptophan/tyrosine transport system substrate-binding protein
MTRHQLIRGLVALVALLALTNQCNSQDSRPKIGWLTLQPKTNASAELKSFVEGLRERDQTLGTTFNIEARYADGDVRLLRPLAEDLVRSGVKIIVATSQPALEAAYSVSQVIPIVARMSDDPVKTGMARSRYSPGGNVTGTFSLFEELASVRLTQLQRAAPDLRKVGLLLTVGHGDTGYWLNKARQTAASRGLDVYVMNVNQESDLDAVFAKAHENCIDGILAFRSPVITSAQQRITDLSNRYRIPGIFDSRDFVESGAFMSYGPNVRSVFRSLAGFVDRILRGEEPGNIPIGQPRVFELVINVKAAGKLGVAVPSPVLTSADLILE